MKINYNCVDSQVIGILVIVPVVGIKNEPIIETYNRCSTCERQPVHYAKFCSICGGQIVEVTDKIKYYNSFVSQNIPLPDVRKEMADLGIEDHLPFSEDEDTSDENFVWKFVFKSYAALGHRTDYMSYLQKLDIEQISSDLEEAKEKFKSIIEKHDAKIVFGIAGDFAVW
jgi:hypothetical protein